MIAASETATRIAADIEALPQKTTATVRKVRRSHSRTLRAEDAALVLGIAREFVMRRGLRWVAYELIRDHKPAFESLDDALLDELGQGMNSWDCVDAFGRTLSGPAWLRGLATDALIRGWATSDDLWRRRAALVSAVALNMRSICARMAATATLRARWMYARCSPQTARTWCRRCCPGRCANLSGTTPMLSALSLMPTMNISQPASSAKSAASSPQG